MEAYTSTLGFLTYLLTDWSVRIMLLNPIFPIPGLFILYY